MTVVPLQSGRFLDAVFSFVMGGRAYNPEGNDVQYAVERSASGGAGGDLPFRLPCAGDSVVKMWEPAARRGSGSSVSSSSTDVADDVECGVFRSPAKSWVGDLSALEKINVLRYGEKGDETALSASLSPSDYIDSCVNARRNILECYALLAEYRAKFTQQCERFVPADFRMERLLEKELILPPVLQSFKRGYEELCCVYSEYVRVACVLGLLVRSSSTQAKDARISFDSSTSNFALQEPSCLSFGACASCEARLCAGDFACLNCGEFMLDIPQERVALFKASCNLSWLLQHTAFFCEVTHECLCALEDLDVSSV